MNAIRSLAEARQALAHAQQEAARRIAEVQRETADAVADATRHDTSRYNAALTAGWSPDELRKIGFTEPEKKTRPRRSRANTELRARLARTDDNSTTDASDNTAAQE